MENNQKPKLGGGLLTVSIIQLVFSGLGIIGVISAFLMKDVIEQQLDTLGETIPPTSISELVIGLTISIILVLGIILIMCKKALGVYTYFTCVIINLIYSIIMTGFNPFMLAGLILPILMAIFISKKKEVFGFGVNTNDMNA